MSKFANLIGQKFNRLTIVDRGSNDKHDNATWLCICDCNPGIVLENSIPTGSLKSGNTKSCGCLNKFAAGEASFNGYHYSYSIRENFCLNKELFQEITSRNCYYCGIEPKIIYQAKTSNGPYIGNTIDR